MSDNPWNISPDFLGEYVQIASESLTRSETILLELEKSPLNAELIDELFRIYHSIKGDSGVLGIKPVASTAHEIESLMERVRSGELVITPEMVDLLLDGKSEIKRLLVAVQNQEPAAMSDALVERLRNYDPDAPAIADEPPVESAPPMVALGDSPSSSPTEVTSVTVRAENPAPRPGPVAEKPESPGELTTQLLPYTIFSAGGLRCTISINDAYQVIVRPKITRLPNVEAFLSGVINHQGRILPVLDLKKKLELPALENPPEHEKIIIVRHQGTYLGLLVDEVYSVVSFTESEIFMPRGELMRLHRSLITGAVRVNDDIVLILNLPRVLERSAG